MNVIATSKSLAGLGFSVNCLSPSVDSSTFVGLLFLFKLCLNIHLAIDHRLRTVLNITANNDLCHSSTLRECVQFMSLVQNVPACIGSIINYWKKNVTLNSLQEMRHPPVPSLVELWPDYNDLYIYLDNLAHPLVKDMFAFGPP